MLKILLRSAVICIERVFNGKEINQCFQNYKRHEADQGHSKKLLERVLRVTSK